MQGRTAGAFGLGFAAGALVTAGLLAFSGSIDRPPEPVATQAPSKPPPQPSVDQTSPPISVPAPPGASPRQEADRIDALPNLIVPVRGVPVGALQDTFEDPRTGGKHEAIDILARRGTPVLAASEGNVVKLFKSERGGLTVYQFDNSRTWCFYYAHLDRYAPGLKEGVLLRQGDVLGYVGTTGDAPADTPHLHFSVFRLGPEKQWWKGDAVNPLPLIRTGG